MEARPKWWDIPWPPPDLWVRREYRAEVRDNFLTRFRARRHAPDSSPDRGSAWRRRSISDRCARFVGDTTRSTPPEIKCACECGLPIRGREDTGPVHRAWLFAALSVRAGSGLDIGGIKPQSGRGRVAILEFEVANPHQHALVLRQSTADALTLRRGQSVAVFSDHICILGVQRRLIAG